MMNMIELNYFSGIHSGVCTILKKKLGHDVLYFACRHHILEIILRNVTEIAWPVTNSPNVPIFKRLKDNWAKIDTSLYDIGIEDDIIKDVLHDNKNNILEFIEDQFQVKILLIKIVLLTLVYLNLNNIS